MTPFVVPLTAVAATGDATQVFQTGATVGTTAPGEKRVPINGILFALDITPDGTNGGLLEVWDANGEDLGANVNTAVAITNAQLAAGITAGTARLIWTSRFTGSTSTPKMWARGLPFQRGLVMRFSNATPTGTCQVNVDASGVSTKFYRI